MALGRAILSMALLAPLFGTVAASPATSSTTVLDGQNLPTIRAYGSETTNLTIAN